jgi:hypothetical protein
MVKNSWVSLLLLVMVLVVPIACKGTAKPASFELRALKITPAEVTVGQTVDISAEVKNVGGTEGNYTATLIINGVQTQTREIKLAPETMEMLTFTVTTRKSGTHNIELGSLTGTFSVSPIPAYSNPQTYRVIITSTIQNASATTPDFVKVWMPTMVGWDSQRDVATEKITPTETSAWKDPQSGTGILFWEFRGQPTPGNSLTIIYQFTYTCYEVNYEIDPAKVTAYNKDDPDYVIYTRSEKYLEVDDPAIMETAKSLAGDKTNPYEIARLMYEYVINHMTWKPTEHMEGAKFALQNGYGKSPTYSALFVALCRAAGIPARPVDGRWATSARDDSLVWAEFYLPGYGWVPVDPTIESIRGSGGDYFGHLDNKRLIFNKELSVLLHPMPTLINPLAVQFKPYWWEYQGVFGSIKGDIDYSITPIAGK